MICHYVLVVFEKVYGGKPLQRNECYENPVSGMEEPLALIFGQ